MLQVLGKSLNIKTVMQLTWGKYNKLASSIIAPFYELFVTVRISYD
ncbi:hypothetical protein GCM10023189_36380 [Nibrella saemangeumensis]|uniref:Uncharacterized protein n=1 Tax=Nibrella saemangeumensis TaxID=1084526 RepID=A0ABP8N4B6_9BACT